MKISALLTVSIFAATLGLAGCALSVGPSSPHPNVMINATDAPSALVLADNIQEIYVIPGTGSVNPVNVTGWRTTLEAGFHNAFPDGADSSGRKLEILEASLSFSPRAVGAAGTAAVSANIRFKARLVSASGEELGVLAATAQAPEAITNVSGTTDNAAKAVEAMYEMLATKLATRVSTPLSAPKTNAKVAKIK